MVVDRLSWNLSIGAGLPLAMPLSTLTGFTILWFMATPPMEQTQEHPHLTKRSPKISTQL
jgi:hypothetical protein